MKLFCGHPDAEVAGLVYILNHTAKGITAKKAIDKMKILQIETDRFAIFKDKLICGKENFFLGAPYMHASYYMEQALCDKR
ncbi:hypothetical protein [Parasitella parasitica]|uniref:Peptidase M16 middle/third domain-containing protein n=1 Tax=Parasitella parasitica TaxID=35722 RepID=A0A0B7NNW0_9FUNG|nr:hypothetical protein [Parasitella parasitica]